LTDFEKISVLYQGYMNWLGFQGRGLNVKVRAKANILVNYLLREMDASKSTL